MILFPILVRAERVLSASGPRSIAHIRVSIQAHIQRHIQPGAIGAILWRLLAIRRLGKVLSMPLRQKLIIACLAASALTPLPALARDSEAVSDTAPEAAPEVANVAKRLSDPANQVAATVALTALSEALLDIRI